jgi:glycosyltransferase involved in cell wall biosynthesis
VKKNSEWPKVSVVISTYNRPKQLEQALASVHAQTFDDFEVVIIDDCSPDPETMQKVLAKWYDKFAERDIDLIAYRMEINSGYQCFPKNRGVERSRGDYIAYLDDDNTWRPDHLQTLTDAIESNMSLDMVYSRLCYVVSDEETRKRMGGEIPEGDAIGVEWNPHLLSERNYIDTNTILHSRGAFWRMVRESGYGWDEKLRRFGDWNFVWRWGVFGNNAQLVDKVTVDYYWHTGMMQLTRPAVEVPVCFNYAQYMATRKETGRSLQSGS